MWVVFQLLYIRIHKEYCRYIWYVFVYSAVSSQILWYHWTNFPNTSKSTKVKCIQCSFIHFTIDIKFQRRMKLNDEYSLLFTQQIKVFTVTVIARSSWVSLLLFYFVVDKIALESNPLKFDTYFNFHALRSNGTIKCEWEVDILCM